MASIVDYCGAQRCGVVRRRLEPQAARCAAALRARKIGCGLQLDGIGWIGGRLGRGLGVIRASGRLPFVEGRLPAARFCNFIAIVVVNRPFIIIII
jgi:hypothetical protein